MKTYMIDKYGNKIYNIDEDMNIDVFDENQAVIVRTKNNIETKDFKHLLDVGGYRIYANKKAEMDLPIPINGTLYTSSAVVIISGPRFNYIVGVQDSSKKFVTTVRGGRLANETFLECMIRELEEETTIKKEEISYLQEIDLINYYRPYFGVRYPGQCQRYIIVATLSMERIREIQNYKSSEIRNIHVIKLKTFLKPLRSTVIRWNIFDYKFIHTIISLYKIPIYTNIQLSPPIYI